MIRYFIRHYWRYLAMALAFATISFLANSCEVKAEVHLSSAILNYINESNTSTQYLYSGNNGYWANLGIGDLSFTLIAYRKGTNTTFQVPLVKAIYAYSGSDTRYVCNYGTVNVSQQGSEDVIGIVYNVVCRVNMGSSGLTQLVAVFDAGNPNSWVTMTSSIMTFGTDLNLDISQAISNQETATRNLLTQIRDSINTNTTNNITNLINNINNNHNALLNAILAQQNQAHQDAQAQKEATDNINDSINDSTTEDPTNDLNDMTQNETSNSVISDLLLLPINMFQNILNSINGACNSFNLGSLFNSNLVLPCINIKNYLGNSLYNVIDVIISGLFVLSLRKKFVDIFENITSLKDRGNELE